jgi:hypothetical protein
MSLHDLKWTVCAGSFLLATLCGTATTLHQTVCALGFSKAQPIFWTGLFCGNTAMTAAWQTHSCGLPGPYHRKNRFAIGNFIASLLLQVTMFLLATGPGCQSSCYSDWAAVGRSQGQGSPREWKRGCCSRIFRLPLFSPIDSIPIFKCV